MITLKIIEGTRKEELKMLYNNEEIGQLSCTAVGLSAPSTLYKADVLLAEWIRGMYDGDDLQISTMDFQQMRCSKDA